MSQTTTDDLEGAGAGELARALADRRVSATELFEAAVARIEQAITEINAIASAIADAVEQQGMATSEIARNVTDAVIALEAAFGPGPGVIVIAGTGSVAYGRNVAGQTAHAGGWGFAISDEGSGHWIGRTAVSGVMRAYDEGRADADARNTLLPAGIMRAWGVGTHGQLVLAANATPARDFAGLFPEVLRAADAGDASAADAETAANAPPSRNAFIGKRL